MTKMEMLDTFCILAFDGLKSESCTAATFCSDALTDMAGRRGADLLAELRVDGEDLRVTNEGESENGNGVRRLPGKQTCVIGRADHWLVLALAVSGIRA